MASTSESATQKKIILVSSDQHQYEIDVEVAEHSQTLKHMIEDGCADSPIPLPNVTSNILAKVIEYCKRHTEADTTNKSSADDLTKFDEEFVKVDQNTLFDTILAANYLNIKSLMDLMCQNVANMIKGKKPEELRELFHIKNDYTKDEEEEVRKENAWAFE